MKKDEYRVIPCQKDITCLDDSIDASLYLIQGDGAAVAIDTTMGEGCIPDILKEKITEDPVTLLVTHGHCDHALHVEEFSEYYMAPEDDYLLEKNALLKRIPLRDGDVIRVPGVKIRVIAAAGHTPGSLIFVDEERKAIFTGDAYGSGCGVWMQVPGSLDMSGYIASLSYVIMELEKLGVDDTWTFYGGHIEQKNDSRLSPYNPLCLSLLRDMKTLSEKLLSGEITGEESDARHYTEEIARYASYGRAEMIYLQSRVK